jgi:hypothetical protein
MPQVVSVWLEQLGHRVQYETFCGTKPIEKILPTDVDFVLIASGTCSADLAYCIGRYYRSLGIATGIGGHHARSYSQECTQHFDYVFGFTDKALLKEVLSSREKHVPGIRVSTRRQITEIASLRERWRLMRSGRLEIIPMLGSVGCPYHCDFCVDHDVEYSSLPRDQLADDLAFLSSAKGNYLGLWYDPNFGVRFDHYMELIEEAQLGSNVTFGGEASLNALTEKRVKRLHENGFRWMAPGVESWRGYDTKLGVSDQSPWQKVGEVSDRLNMIDRYMSVVQVNFIFGLDHDEGAEPFELTKEFIRRTPGIYPNFQILSVFGDNTPLGKRLLEAGRVIPLPHLLLDGSLASNVVFENYPPAEFYARLADLTDYSFSMRSSIRRYTQSTELLARGFIFLKTFFKISGSYYWDLAQKIEKDDEFRAFFSGESETPPLEYQRALERGLGGFSEWLPTKADYESR